MKKLGQHASVVCLPLLAALLSAGCGAWIGKHGDDSESGTVDSQTATPVVVASATPDSTTSNSGSSSASTGSVAAGAAAGGSVKAASGGVMMQKVELSGGQPFSAYLALSGANLTASASVDYEISVVAADGTEQAYARTNKDDAGISFTPPADGDYTVIMKNNSSETVELDNSVLSGEKTAKDPVSADERTDAPFKNYTLKAVVTFSSVCKQYSADGNSTLSFTAPTGEYYVQPFVFWGKVGADSKVSLLSSASIAIKADNVTINLVRLGDLPLATYREHSSLTNAEHENYTRIFYQNYFGAAGELYTLDTFRFGGDCAAAKTVKVPTDAGQADIKLSIVDASIGVDTSFKVRPTVSTAFSIYDGAGARISDWTQCTYDRLTGAPMTYNGDAATCKSLSIAAPPFIRLDYKLPSASGAGVTAVSDPTRILYYGHSYAKDWYTSIIANADALRAGTQTTVELSRCMNNGGLVAVPLSADATYIPLGEFNTKVGDVINLARKPGSYTALTDFYQGNVDAAGELTYPTCIPQGSSTCADFKLLKVKMTKCTLKADSGISVPAVGSSFIYPEYFDISGVIND